MLFESDRLRLGVSDGIATLWLGDEASRNTIGLRFFQDLGRAVTAASRSPVIDVLVVRSGVRGVFAAGPDLDELAHLDDAEERLEHAAIGQHALRRFADLSRQMRTVAVIEGRCSNAGLELALACSHRLAVASPETVFSFDGVRRGVPPCWGLTVRLPQTVGLQAALALLAGTPVPARAAQRLGLVDRVVGARQARTELLWYVAELQDLAHTKPRRNGAPSWWQRMREAGPFAAAIERRARRSNADPAYQAIIDAVMHGWREGPAEAMSKERRVFANVVDSSEALRRQGRARRVDRLLRSSVDVSLPERVVVIGSDETGIDIATLALAAGFRVSIPESVPAARTRGDMLLRESMNRAASTGWFNALEVDAKTAGVFASAEHRFDDHDLVVVASKAAQGPSALLTIESRMPSTTTLVSLTPMPNLTGSFHCADRCLSMQAIGPLAAGGTVELRPLPATTSLTVSRAARWLDACGMSLLDAPALTREPVPAVFAA